MKIEKLIILLIVAITISSCSTIRFGRSTTVTIETEHPGDVVDILAIGPKNVVDMQQVTLPYKYKVKHNNLPQRVDIVSDNYIYDPFTIGAVHKGEFIGELSKYVGWITTAATAIGMAVAGFSSELIPLWGGYMALDGSLLAIGYTAETDIPDSKFYLTTAVPIDSVNLYQLEGWYLKQRALDDTYTLLSQGEYKLSKAKATFLLETNPTAELFYLRGISSYYLGEHKAALKDLNEALYRLNAEVNPGLRDEITECISSVEQSIAIKKEERNRMWSQIAGTVLQTGAQAYSMYQQAELVKYRQNYGMSPSGVAVNPSKLSQENLNVLIDPNFAIQQVLSQEMQEYQQFCRYNKKADGSDYSLAEYRALRGAAIQHAKENGYDILAEQRKQMEEDRKWREEQRQKDKENWFARYGYDVNSSSNSYSSNDSQSEPVNADNNYVANSNVSSSQERSDSKNNSDEPELDSKLQYRTNPVSSEDFKKIKTVDLYYRDGNKARKMISNAELCQKGAFLYIKIGNKYYPRCSPNWGRFRNAINYGGQQIYYND